MQAIRVYLQFAFKIIGVKAIKAGMDPSDELSEELEFTFQSVVDELPRLRRAAEEQLKKEV